MILDNVNIVDSSDSVKRDGVKDDFETGKFKRPVKTRPLSFTNIYARFKEYFSTEAKLKRAEVKLEEAKDKLMSTGYTGVEDKKLDKMLRDLQN